MAEKKDQELHKQLIRQMITLSTAGFGLVAALAWNEAIQGFVQKYLEGYIPGSGLWGQFVYAIIITIFAVLVTYQISKLVRD